jgi:hypothetical protein
MSRWNKRGFFQSRSSELAYRLRYPKEREFQVPAGVRNSESHGFYVPLEISMTPFLTCREACIVVQMNLSCKGRFPFVSSSGWARLYGVFQCRLLLLGTHHGPGATCAAFSL